jgi:ribosomal protein S18 acetylase RimI-like enzyme
MTDIVLRLANPSDYDAIWSIIEPIIIAGETYALDRNMNRDEAISYWFLSNHEVFVALIGENILGTYFLCNNQKGNGNHVSNCGFMTAQDSYGKGVARTMCLHAIATAKERGFRSMQFNFVVSSNTRAVKLWESCGYKIVGTLPKAFNHPSLGYIDAYVMFQEFV